MKILVLGISGMLGNAVFKIFHKDKNYQVYGTIRNAKVKKYFDSNYHKHIICGLDVLDPDALINVIGNNKPDVVINCIGLVKQLDNSNNPLVVLPINSILPHRISSLCKLSGARLIHISTDCVFSGNKGGYVEEDISDAQDLYGKSKYIGEINDDPDVVTVRTSIIGHELISNHSLVNWFLTQKDSVNGFRKVIFSGLTTMELTSVIKDYIIPNPELAGLYHISTKPISKYELLQLIADRYGKDIQVVANDDYRLDRSLNSSRFTRATGYKAPKWAELIDIMYQDYKKESSYHV